MTLCAESGNHLFLAWRCDAGNDGTSLRCRRGCRGGVATRHSGMNGARMGEYAVADGGGGGGDTCSCRLALDPRCIRRTLLYRARVSTFLEGAGDTQGRLQPTTHIQPC